MDKDSRNKGYFTVEELKMFDKGVLTIENFIKSKATTPFLFTFKFETKMDKYFGNRINF
jgi:hypothetical protein